MMSNICENGLKPLLEDCEAAAAIDDHEGDEDEEEKEQQQQEKRRRECGFDDASASSSSSCKSKLDLLESFDNGSIIISSSTLQSDMQTILNVVNLYVGVGLLSLGYAFRLGGWICVVVLAVLSIMFAYSAKLICWSFDKIPVGMVPSYPNLGFTAFGNPGHWLVMLMGVAEFFGGSCMCLIIVWQSIEMLLPPGPWCFLRHTCISSRDAVVIGSPLIMLPAIWIRTFSRLTSISISGILSSLILIAVVVTAFALDPTREAVHDPSSSVHKAVNWAHLPIATGILIVSLSGHAGLPSLRRSMKNPQNFKFCLNLAFLAMFLLYATMAGFSYFYFGQATQVLVTENLNKASGVTGFVLLRLGCFSITINEVITVLVALSAYSTIPALIYVAAELIVDIISHPSSSHHRHPGFVDLLARTIILTLAYIVSYLAYHVLGSVESIVGGVCSVSVSLLLPAVFYYKLHEQEMSFVKKSCVLGICALGIICLLGIATINILELSNIIKL